MQIGDKMEELTINGVTYVKKENRPAKPYVIVKLTNLNNAIRYMLY